MVSDVFLRRIFKPGSAWGGAARDAYVRLTTEHRLLGGHDQSDEADEVDAVPSTVELVHPRNSALFDYQQDLVGQISRLVAGKDERIGLVSLPTGSGKTRTAVWALLELVASGATRRVLWLAPTRELLDQATRAFQAAWRLYPSHDRILLAAAHRSASVRVREGVAVLLCTPQMLHLRLRSILRDLGPDTVVFDEAHFAVAPTYAKSIAQCVLSGAALLGLSATPGRSSEHDTDALVQLFKRRLMTSQLLGRNPLKSLVGRGILANVEYQRIALNSGFPGLLVESRGARRMSVSDLASNDRRFEAVVRATLEASQRGRTLVFAASIRHALAITAALVAEGGRAMAVHAGMRDTERRRALERFEAGELSILVNKQILATGYDCPAVRTVVLTVPIGSPVLFEQIVGRVSRGPAVGGNRDSVVLSLDDNLRLNGTPSSYARFRDHDWDL